MEDKRLILIEIANSKPEYLQLCNRISKNYGEDIFQEVCEKLLTMPIKKLPEIQYFNFWFYRVAFGTMSYNSRPGKIFSRICTDESVIFDIPENENENLIKEAEQFMLSLSEFENRIVLLYNDLGNMKRVQKQTGISYSSLRYVKEKLKLKAKVA